MEIDYGTFRRQVALGADVDVTKAQASYDRGILTVVLPIAQRAAAAGAGGDHGDAAVNDEAFEPLSEMPERAAGPAGAAAEGDRRLPRVDDAARDRPGALDQADRRRRRQATGCSRS